MRILMLGTGPFAVPTFRALAASSHRVLALVTRPPHAQPGRKPPPNPMAEAAESLGIAVEQPESINDPQGLRILRFFDADLLVVCDYGQILSPEALATARLGGINLHASLLPAYRGAAPIHWAIYEGQVETGVTVIHMTPHLDAGPIVVQQRTAILSDETTGQLEPRLAELGVAAVMEAIDRLEAWDGQEPLGHKQNPLGATRAPRLKKSDGRLDWTRPAAALACQVRAFQPWPGSYSFLLRSGEPPMRLTLAAVAASATSSQNIPPSSAPSGARSRAQR